MSRPRGSAALLLGLVALLLGAGTALGAKRQARRARREIEPRTGAHASLSTQEALEDSMLWLKGGGKRLGSGYREGPRQTTPPPPA